ncbi:lipase/esterase [Lactiplantibacillus plantarum]|nr:lipase/esterase [Lactiplantibacillus plantarum]MCG0576141.1 putative lipase/esterase (putative) [Lactiplantibacillus plantarum]MCG0732867.1 putative lipase/esterase (putative) [Lactiplantibacillus plantarum]
MQVEQRTLNTAAHPFQITAYWLDQISDFETAVDYLPGRWLYLSFWAGRSANCNPDDGRRNAYGGLELPINCG